MGAKRCQTGAGLCSASFQASHKTTIKASPAGLIFGYRDAVRLETGHAWVSISLSALSKYTEVYVNVYIYIYILMYPSVDLVRSSWLLVLAAPSKIKLRR